MTDSRHTRAVAAALFVTVLWSSSWVIIRFGLDDQGLEPITFAGLRYATAAAVLVGIALASPSNRQSLRMSSSRQLRRLIHLGIVFYALTQGAQFIALDHQPAATTSLVLSLTPLLVSGLAMRSVGERPTGNQVIGAALVAAGSAAYLSGDLVATAAGMAAAVVALASNVRAALLGRSVNRSLTMPPIVVTAVSMAIGSSLMLAVGMGVEGLPTLSATAVVIVLWLAVVNTALAFTMWNASLRHLSAPESAVINNTMLVQIAVLAWVFLGEVPSPIQVAGILMVTLGIIWSQVRRRLAS